jgi:hypothetical protein
VPPSQYLLQQPPAVVFLRKLEETSSCMMNLNFCVCLTVSKWKSEKNNALIFVQKKKKKKQKKIQKIAQNLNTVTGHNFSGRIGQSGQSI